MTLCEELFFEITVSGTKSELKKLVSFLESGGLDDFFEYCKKRNIKLVNCSSTTVIDSIPRDALTNVLKKGK